MQPYSVTHSEMSEWKALVACFIFVLTEINKVIERDE